MEGTLLHLLDVGQAGRAGGAGDSSQRHGIDDCRCELVGI